VAAAGADWVQVRVEALDSELLIELGPLTIRIPRGVALELLRKLREALGEAREG